MNKPNKPVIVLKALLAGLTVDLGGVKVFLGTADDGRRILVHTITNVTDGNKPKYIEVPCPLGRFLGMCEIISDKDIVLIAANITLNEIKNEGADRRPRESYGSRRD